MSFYEIFKKDELNDGEMKMKEINGHEYMIAQVGDNYYASDNRCPHMGGNLSIGKLDGNVVTCPRHHSQFDITDGHVNTMDRLVRNQIILRQSIEVSKKSKNI